MTPEQKAAYVFAQSVSALIEAMGMLSENLYRIKIGESPAWATDEFRGLVDRYGITHNDVLGLFQQ